MNLRPVLLAALLTACAPAAAALAAPAADTVLVTKVTDGDTFHIASGDTVRVRGLDTPETKAPGKPVQCWGPQATAFATGDLLNHRVQLITDPGDLRDRYGRLVAEVHVDGRSYAVEAVRAGAGRAYLYDKKHPASDWAQIQAAQAEAQAAHRGLWGPTCNGGK